MAFINFQTSKEGKAVLYQDNTSAIQLHKNGKSSSNKIKHMKIRYFWIKIRWEAESLKFNVGFTNGLNVGRYANEAVARRNIQKVQNVKPPQPLARAEGVCWGIYLASVYIIHVGHPGERLGVLRTKK